jgi:hypothetical protein
MSPETILYIIIAAIISIIAAGFMYGYRTKYKGKLRWIFGILRFLSLFALLILLINPEFKSISYTTERPQLPIIIDNSSSIIELNQQEALSTSLDQLKSNEALNTKFDIAYYSFGNGFSKFDSLSNLESNSNIGKALKSINELYGGQKTPVILLTDGNQTIGSDFEFSSTLLKHSVYPVILGDSIKFTDLKIEQLNTNRYAFLKNKFPVEAIIVYSGKESVNSQFVISQGNTVVYRESLSFSSKNNTKVVTTTLSPTAVGLQRYTATITPLIDEKNKVNNEKRFGVEVIDQATNVLIVSDILHPDLGMLKKSIATNEQRTVTFKTPEEAVNILNDYQLVILYQPVRKFGSVFKGLDALKKNTFIITGTQTDWVFLNSIQSKYSKEIVDQTERVSGQLNSNYGTFALDDIGFEDLPPLNTLFGQLSINVPHEVILEQTVDGISSESPMLATMEQGTSRHAIWDGEALWKWRAQSFLKVKSFEDFDQFVANMVQYLASNKRRSRLEVSNETFYYNNKTLKISAQYFDKNFVFDTRASLSISAVNTETKERLVFPLLLRTNYYQVDLSTLDAGSYTYTVSVKNQEVARSGSFTILEFNVEQQFLNANISKLNRVAATSKGKAFFPNQIEDLINSLMGSDIYVSIQKSEKKVVSLIDWEYLLILIVLLLTIEWFIRKFNGLI